MTTWIKQSSTEKSTGNSEKSTANSIEKSTANSEKPKGRLLVVVGTYSIGKERIVMGIAKALGTKIYAPVGKRRICGCLEDEVLMGMMTDDPREGQVHMTRYVSLFLSVLQDSLTKRLLPRVHITKATYFYLHPPPSSRCSYSNL
jgi:DNA cross-link repair 1A protein